jgi:hypothetical protein
MEEVTTLPAPIIGTDELEIINAIPARLRTNTQISQLGEAALNKLLAEIEAGGMNDEMDAKANGLLVKCKTRYEEMFTGRKPGTELLDQIKSKFTSLEFPINPTGKGNLYSRLVAKRNEWATAKMRKRQEEEQKEKEKLLKAQEAITLKTNAEAQIHQFLSNELLRRKNEMMRSFEGITLAGWDEGVQTLNSLPVVLMYADFQKIPVKVYGQYHNPEELETIYLNARVNVGYDKQSSKFKEELESYLVELNDKLPAKKSELLKIKQAAEAEAALKEQQRILKENNDAIAAKALQDQLDAAKAEKDALELEQKNRTELQSQSLANEQAAKDIVTAQTLETESTIAKTEAMFDSQMVIQEGNTGTMPIASFNIVPTTEIAAAWLPIINFYFADPKNQRLTFSEMTKTTLGKMKKFCEDAYKNEKGAKLESKYLRFEPVYKVRTNKEDALNF